MRSHLCQLLLKKKKKNYLYLGIIIVVAVVLNHFSRLLGSIEGFSRMTQAGLERKRSIHLEE